jgi:hypothetical protein
MLLLMLRFREDSAASFGQLGLARRLAIGREAAEVHPLAIERHLERLPPRVGHLRRHAGVAHVLRRPFYPAEGTASPSFFCTERWIPPRPAGGLPWPFKPGLNQLKTGRPYWGSA